MTKRGHSLLFVYGLLALVLLLPLAFFLDSGRDAPGWNGLLAWLIMSYAAIHIAIPLLRNEQRIMEMTFWLFGYIFMGVVPFVQILANRYPWAGSYGEDTVRACLLMILLGMFAYRIGVRIASRGSPSPRAHRAVTLSAGAYVAFSCAAIAAAVVLLALSHGFQSLFLPRNANVSVYDTKAQGLIFNQFIRVPVFVCLLLGLVLWKLGELKRLWQRGFTVVLAAVNLVVANPISTPRLWFGSVMLALAMMLVPWRKNAYFYWIAGYLVLFMAVFPYADLFRNDLNAKLETQKMSQVMTDKGDYDAFQMVLNTSQYVDEFGPTEGKQLMGAIFFWVPRSVWADKPVGSGQFVAQQMGYSFTNLSSPLWAEAYINFGYPGIAGMFLLYGYLTGRLQRRFLATRKNDGFTHYHALVPFLSAYQFFLLRGDLMNGIAYLSVFLMLIYALTLRKKEKRDAEGAEAAGRTAMPGGAVPILNIRSGIGRR